MRQEIRGGGLRRRMMLTVVPAAIGTVAGFAYGKLTLDPVAYPRLAGMYAAFGAAGGILLLRVVTIFWTIFADYFQKND